MTAHEKGRDALGPASSTAPAPHLHKWCSCPPGYCSRTCIECLTHADQADEPPAGGLV